MEDNKLTEEMNRHVKEVHNDAFDVDVISVHDVFSIWKLQIVRSA